MLRKLLLSLAAVMVLTVGAAAYQVPHAETDASSPFFGMNTNVQNQADFLHALDLFQGTQQGYDLDRSMTRSEAAVMLVRLLGQEETALDTPQSHPFTDVPSWADPYVGWLYANGLARGVSPTAYGASSKVTAEQYLIFLTRALHGRSVADDHWKESWGVNLKELQQSLDKAGFLRRDAVSLSVLALCQYTDTAETLAARLVRDGAIAEDIFRTEAPTIYESQWGTTDTGTPYRCTAGVTRYGTANGLAYVADSGEDSAGYFLVTGRSGLQAVDCMTLEIVGKPMALSGDGTVQFWASTKDWAVVQQVGKSETVLYQFDPETGQALIRFDLPYTEESPFPDENGGKQLLERTLLHKEDGYYWGGAGLYRVENGVLRCLQQRPADDLLLLEDGSLYMLTHTPGYPAQLGPSVVMERHPGNEILYRSPTGVWETALRADTGHDIIITHLLKPDGEGLLKFVWTEWDTRAGDGADYVLLRQGKNPSIRVTRAYKGYPETVVPVEQIPAYHEQLRQTEQERLNDLGIGV